MILNDGSETKIMSIENTKTLNRHLKKKIKNSNYNSSDLIMEGVMLDTDEEKLWVSLVGIYNLRDSSINILRRMK